MLFRNKIELSKSPFKRILYIITGFICIGLGIIGIILPIMPTTVFFLLAAYFFSKSSDKFYNKLLNNKYFGRYIRDYLEGRKIPFHARVISISFLWITILISAIFFVNNVYIKILLLVIAVAVTIHIIAVGKKKEFGS